jgi:heme A synthase
LRHTGERLDLHLAFAFLVAVHVLWLLLRVSWLYSDRPRLFRGTGTLAALLALQLLLGAGAYLGKYTTLLRLPAEGVVYLTTIHLVVGGLMLATGVILTLRVARLSQAEKLAAERGVLPEQASI